MNVNWKGVLPAITTAFNADLSVDYGFLAEHAGWMIDSGCAGIVPLGSLGEGATLTHAEKRTILETLVATVGDRGPVVAAISALSTSDAVALARDAQSIGCSGLMVLPPYVYSTDWREMKAHVAAVMRATTLPCMLYNNPVAYRTDFVAEQIAELAREMPNLESVKESSTDVRRVTAIRALIGDRLEVLIGVDDLIVEGVAAGATGWIAGLVNAFPLESVAIHRAAMAGRWSEANELYRWFLPLLRMDTVPKFVQLIKLVQEKVGRGSARVRAPRLELDGAELHAATEVIEHALATKPRLEVR
ncbi:MAG TPA: dihydrodipicolinate synthase family protein [Thermoanaerobaculia bacterium]|nr:dihydrodipicolinate synthase family protein [Thermoanaerobaculia bacterium]